MTKNKQKQKEKMRRNAQRHKYHSKIYDEQKNKQQQKYQRRNGIIKTTMKQNDLRKNTFTTKMILQQHIKMVTKLGREEYIIIRTKM